jgi:hypothetical protein
MPLRSSRFLPRRGNDDVSRLASEPIRSGCFRTDGGTVRWSNCSEEALLEKARRSGRALACSERPSNDARSTQVVNWSEEAPRNSGARRDSSSLERLRVESDRRLTMVVVAEFCEVTLIAECRGTYD